MQCVGFLEQELVRWRAILAMSGGSVLNPIWLGRMQGEYGLRN
jgi:hypothetical protein